MKKLFLILFIIPVLCFSQGLHQDFLVLTTAGATEFYLQGTATATSAPFRLYEINSVGFWSADTAGNDSTNASLALQISADTTLISSSWETFKTIFTNYSPAADSTIDYEPITNTPMPNTQFGRYVITGLGDNAKSTSGLYKIIHMNYESSGRR